MLSALSDCGYFREGRKASNWPVFFKFLEETADGLPVKVDGPNQIAAPESNYASGFSLIETLVALGILGIVIAAASSSLIQSLHHNHRAEMLFEGVHAAQTVLDDLRFEDISSLPTSGTDQARTVTSQSKRQYKVHVTYCKTSSYCTSPTVRQLHVRVEYKSRTVYETETVFTEFGSSADDDNGSSGSSSSATSSASSSVASSSSSSSSVTSSSSSSSSSRSSSSSSSSRSSSSSSSRSRCRTYRC